MIEFNKVKTIFFDYDGTLHNSITIYFPAFIKAYSYLVENKLAKPRQWREEEISKWLGYNSKEMWSAFMPELSESVRHKCSHIIGEEMKAQIDLGKPKLYEGALETLQYLKDKGYDLVFISNCGIYYMNAHKRLFKLDNYFKDFICSEEYNYIPKYEILKKVKIKYAQDMVMVGDRVHDIETGKVNHIYTIGCNYGFSSKGELKNADIVIEDIKALIKYF
jgi:phosphoglycolate phosphatase